MAVLSTCVGACAAIFSIPHDYGAAGALAWSALFLAAGLLAPVAFWWRNEAATILSGQNVLALALVYWFLLDVLQGAYALPVSRDAVVREFLLISVASIGFSVGAGAFRPLAPGFLLAAAAQPWSSGTIFRALVIAFALGIWDFVYRADFDVDVVLRSLLASRFDSAWQREALGDWSAFSYHLQYFGYLVPALAVMLALRLGWHHPRALAGLLMSVSILMFHAQGGGRRVVGAMVLAGLFCWLVHVRRVTLRRVALVLIILGVLAAALQLMLILREVGLAGQDSAYSQFDYLHVDDNFLRVAQMLEFVPEIQPFVGLQYAVFAIVRPVPRVLWPEKPVDGGFALAELLGIPMTTISITAPGEFYVSFGYAGVLLGAFIYGRLSTLADAMLAPGRASVNPLFPSLVLVCLFLGMRSMVEIILMSYVVIAALVIGKALSLIEERVASPAAPGASST